MKAIEEEVYKDYGLDESRFNASSLPLEDGRRVYRRTLSNGFSMVVFIAPNGEVEGRVYEEDGAEFEGFRRHILGEFSSAIKEEFCEVLKLLRDAYFKRKVSQNCYLLPSNPRIYDVKKGFEEYGGFLDWPARKKTAKGDVIFIYSAIPFKGIAFRCSVIDVNEVGEGYGGRTYYSTLLRLEETFEQGYLTLEDFLSHGGKTVRFFHKLSPEASAYLLSKSDLG